jgi:hypothetical protein
VTTREQRLVRVAALVVLVAVVGLKAAPVAMARERALREHVQRRQREVASIREDLGAVGALEASAANVRRQLLALAPRLLSAPTDAEGDAALSVLVRAMVERVGASVERVATLPDSSAVGALRRHALRMELETDAEGFEALLRAIAGSTTLLEMDSLRLAAVEPGSPVTQAERLKIAMVVRAWRTARATTAEADATP